MIDRNHNRRILDSLRLDRALDQTHVASFLAGEPCFQNKDYPFALTPLFVSGAQLPGLRSQVESYVALLEKIVALYRRDASVRAFYGLGASAERLIAAEGELPRSIAICRLDGYLTRSGEELRVLENNADAPAGTFFTPRINHCVRTLLASHLQDCAPALPMDEGQPFLDALLRAYHEAHGAESRPFVAVIQPRGRSNRESEEVVAAMNSSGWPAVLVDPRELSGGADGLFHGGRRVDLIWNKINTGLWNTIVAQAPEVIDLLEAALAGHGPTIHINSFGARHVAEAKTSLAFMHDPRFSDLFLEHERRLVDDLVPWTAKLERGQSVLFEGQSIELAALLRDRRPDLVVKQQYDIRGDGVTVGRSTSPDAWQNVIETLWDTGAVVQRYISPSQYEVVLAREPREATPMNVSLDSFVFNGRFAGLGAKASTHDKVNIFQGGSKLAVVVTHAE